MTRDGRPVAPARDRLAELSAVPELTPMVALFGLLIAAMLGALHALSPGHGKTVVGAYLVGSRGTARHAAFLGLTVTITHTLGVFALGLVTLFARICRPGSWANTQSFQGVGSQEPSLLFAPGETATSFQARRMG